jgi:acyl-CoA dehydrogenase
MSEDQSMQQLILDTAAKIFGDHCDKALLDRAETGELSKELWQLVADNGFDLIGTNTSGTTEQDMFAFIQQCGRFAVPLPIADTLLVNRWRGAETGSKLYAIGVLEGDELRGGRQVRDVPWGRYADQVFGVQQGTSEVVVIDQPQMLAQGSNMAGEPRDSIACLDRTETIDVGLDAFAQVAVTRINLMAGSLQTLLDLGLQFANERVQFGRPIAKFQAIQHSLAVVASEVAAARRAADAAVDAMQDPARFLFEVAASKARIGEAVTVAAEQIHQIHGAMGFTHEHRLHHFSRRAWAWRDEFGNEFFWQVVLGNHLAGLGADNVWQFIATRN